MTQLAQNVDRVADRWVLAMIAAGLIMILLSIIWGLFLNPVKLPNWAENVLVGIASVSGLKLGDCLNTLIALANGRQVERMGNQIAASPAQQALNGAAEGAEETAEAARIKAEQIAEKG